MSVANTKSTSSGSAPRSTLGSEQTTDDHDQTPVRIHGSSTPRSSHHFQLFAPPSDISSVAASTSGSNGASSKTPSENLQEISVAGPSSSSTPYRRNVSRPGSTSKQTPSKSLEKIVSERITADAVRKSLAGSFSKMNISNSISDDSGSLSGNIEPPTKKHKAAYKGQDWIMFKPKRKNRIYECILNHPHDTLKEAKLWVQLYSKQVPHAIIALIQFLADVCGYQDFTVSSIFKYEEENYMELKDFMEENPPEDQKKTGKYLMKASSDWSKQIHNAIYGFIRNLLEIASSTDLLFDQLMLKHLLGMVMTLVTSQNRSMHHTGVVIVVKMNTVFLEIHADINNKLERYGNYSRMRTERIEEQLNTLAEYEIMLHEVLKQLQKVIEAYCCLQEPVLDGMRVTVIEEMFKWFEINPSLLISTKYFYRLMTLVEDMSKKVRAAALHVCRKLIRNDTMTDYMNSLIEKFVEVVIGRVYDVDYKIAASAVNICTDISCMYADAIPVISRDRMTMLVYCKNQELAMAAGQFLVEHLRRYDESGEKNTDLFFKQLIKFSRLMEKEPQNYTPLLVEAVLPYCPELCDWNTMIDWLLKDNPDFKNETTLINIMSHAAQQTITGKPKINRSQVYPKPPKIQNVRNASNIFLIKLYPLLKKYSNDSKSVQLLAEILLAIDFKDRSLGKYMTETMNILKVLQSIFVKNTDKQLLETISVVFMKLCEEICPFKNRSAGLVLTLKEALLKALLDSLENLDKTESPPEDDLSRIEASTFKLSVLFINHDLTELIEPDLLFNNLLYLEDVLTPKSIKSTITCGYWYLIWRLRKIIDASSRTQPVDDLQQQIYQLKRTCNEYIKTCFNFMKNSKSDLIRDEAFQSICNVHVTFRKDLETPTKPPLNELIPIVPEKNQLAELMTFAQMLLFEDENKSTLKTRRISLGNVISLAFLHVIPYQKLAEVYKYYYSHNDDYGDIFTDALQTLRDINAIGLAGIVLQTLTHCFTNTDLAQSEERDNLRALAKQFQIFVARAAEETELILQMGIKYALFADNRYAFLKYLKYLSTALSTNNRKSILNFFISKVPEQDKNHQLITDFISHLKNEHTNKTSGNASVSVASEESYTIEEDSDST